MRCSHFPALTHRVLVPKPPNHQKIKQNLSSNAAKPLDFDLRTQRVGIATVLGHRNARPGAGAPLHLASMGQTSSSHGASTAEEPLLSQVLKFE